MRSCKETITFLKPPVELFIATILLIFVIWNSPSFAESKQNDFINKQKRFIFELYKDKRYFDCIAETQRLLSYEDNISNKSGLTYFIDACYYSGGQYKTVISKLKESNFNKARSGLPNLFLLSHSYLKTGYYKLSADILYMLDYPDIDESGRSKLFGNRAGVFIGNFEYEEILSEIENAGKYMNIFYRSFSLQDFKKDIQGYAEIGLRSKWLSASLSAVLPGAGQVYSGRIIDGILSFALVAGSAYGAYYFYHKDEKPLAITLTFFSCLFYAGNLYGAYNSALYTNKGLNQTFADQITKKYNLYYNPMDYIDTGIFK